MEYPLYPQPIGATEDGFWIRADGSLMAIRYVSSLEPTTRQQRLIHQQLAQLKPYDWALEGDPDLVEKTSCQTSQSNQAATVDCQVSATPQLTTATEHVAITDVDNSQLRYNLGVLTSRTVVNHLQEGPYDAGLFT